MTLIVELLIYKFHVKHVVRDLYFAAVRSTLLASENKIKSTATTTATTSIRFAYTHSYSHAHTIFSLNTTFTHFGKLIIFDDRA